MSLSDDAFKQKAMAQNKKMSLKQKVFAQSKKWA